MSPRIIIGLVVVLSTFLLVAVEAGRIQDHLQGSSTTTTSSNPCPPNTTRLHAFEWMGVGYDVVTGKSKQGRAILDRSVDPATSKTYYEPDSHCSYLVPSDWSVAYNGNQQTTSVSTLYKTFSGFLDFFGSASISGWGVITGIWNKAMFHMKELMTVNMEMKEGTKEQGYAAWTAAVYNVSYAGGPAYMAKLDSVFKQAVEALPKKPTTHGEWELYKEFVMYYGTHCQTSSVFGGQLSLNMLVNTSFVLQAGGTQTMSLMGALQMWFLFAVQPHGSYTNRGQIHINSTLRDNTNSTLLHLGGKHLVTNPPPSTDKVNDWVNSIPFEPAPVYIQELQPVYWYVIESSRHHNVRKFVEYYQAHGEYPSWGGSK